MLIDLTYPIHEGMFKYYSDAEAKISVSSAEISEGVPAIVDNAIRNSYGCSGAYEAFKEGVYRSGYAELKIRSHHGTHIDAPSHKIKDGKKIDCYPVEKFINQCCLVDLTSSDLLRRKKREISIEDLVSNGEFMQQKNATSLILYTGFCDELVRNKGINYEDKEAFEKNFPYLSEDASRFIVDKNPRLNLLGIDSFSVDRCGSNSEVHRFLFENDVLPLETLFNLRELRKGLLKRSETFFNSLGWGNFVLYSVPLNYSQGDAAQTRAYAGV